MIKPGIPNVPSSEAQGRIDDFARDPEMQADADSMAQAFGYPEDQSYSEALQAYDDIAIPRQREMALLGTEFAGVDSLGVTIDGKYYTPFRFMEDKVQEAADILDSVPEPFVKPLIDVFIEAVRKRDKVRPGGSYLTHSGVTPEHRLVRRLSAASKKHYPNANYYLLLYYPGYTLKGGYLVKKK